MLGLWFQSIFVGLCSIFTIAIFLVIYGRMIEVYLTVSVGPIPFTMANRGVGPDGAELFEVPAGPGLSGVSLIMVCVGIYAVLAEYRRGDDITGDLGRSGYTVLLCYTLFAPAAYIKEPVWAALTEAAMKNTRSSTLRIRPGARRASRARGAESHYPTMEIAAIRRRPPVGAYDKDCALFL